MVVDSKGISKAEIPMGDPGFHYRIVSAEKGTEGRVEYHRDKGYRVAKQTNRFAVMGCPRGEFEARQAESVRRADRFKEASGSPTGDMVRDETSIEVTQGLGAEDD